MKNISMGDYRLSWDNLAIGDGVTWDIINREQETVAYWPGEDKWSEVLTAYIPAHFRYSVIGSWS